MEQLIESLKKLGLTRYEAKAHIGLNKIGFGQANEISEISEIPRSRIYDILNELEKKNFIKIKRERPLVYHVIQPSIVFKNKKEEFINNLNSSEEKLEEIYLNKISEVQAPVSLIYSPENIIRKEISIIKNSSKSITLVIGFLLENEAQEMVNAFKSIPQDVEIRILSNSICCIDNKKIEIINEFKKAKLSNLKIIEADLPIVKFLIRDEKELFGTFVQFDSETTSINSKTAIGVFNQYDNICKNINQFFVKKFNTFNL